MDYVQRNILTQDGFEKGYLGFEQGKNFDYGNRLLLKNQ